MAGKDEALQAFAHDYMRYRAILARMSRLVLDFGGDMCFCPVDARETGRYCEVCELTALAREFAE